jgi:hypothetical protein
MLSVSWTRCTIRWLVSVSAPRMQIRHRGGVACVGAGSVRFRTRAPGRSGRGDIAAQPVPAVRASPARRHAPGRRQPRVRRARTTSALELGVAQAHPPSRLSFRWPGERSPDRGCRQGALRSTAPQQPTTNHVDVIQLQLYPQVGGAFVRCRFPWARLFADSLLRREERMLALGARDDAASTSTSMTATSTSGWVYLSLTRNPFHTFRFE